VLIFQHRGLLHSGDDVVEGTKFTMRSDLLFRIQGDEEEEQERKKEEEKKKKQEKKKEEEKKKEQEKEGENEIEGEKEEEGDGFVFC